MADYCTCLGCTRVPLTEDSPLRERLHPHRQGPPPGPDDPRRGIYVYDKLPVERLVMGHPRLVGTVLRLPAVYGPRDDQHRLFGYLKRMDDGRPAILLAENLAGWRWTRGYVENVAEAIALAVMDGRAAGRVYNVGEPDALSEAEWVRAIGRAAGWQGEVVRVPAGLLPETMRPKINVAQHWVVDTTRIRTELGYRETVPRPESLRRTVEWERTHPPEHVDPTRCDYAAEDAVLARLRGVWWRHSQAATKRGL